MGKRNDCRKRAERSGNESNRGSRKGARTKARLPPVILSVEESMRIGYRPGQQYPQPARAGVDYSLGFYEGLLFLFLGIFLGVLLATCTR